MRTKPASVLGSRNYSVPYINSLKVFAYIDFDFEDALERIKNWGFYIPDRKFELGLMTKEKKWTPSYDLMENKYKIMNYEAWRLRRSLQFSQSEVEDLGLSPLYEFLTVEEDDEPTYETKLMQDMIGNIRSPSIRRALCTLAYQGKTPEQMSYILEHDTRAPYTQWNVEQIRYFLKFFWQLEDMSHNSWLRYSKMEEIGKEDRHIEYLTPIINEAKKESITWHGGPYDQYDNMQIMDLVISQQAFYLKDPNKEFSFKASKALPKSVTVRMNVEAEVKAANVGTDGGPLGDVELLIQEEKEKQLGVKAFVNVEDIDGEVSDPKDISFDKEDYLDQD